MRAIELSRRISEWLLAGGFVSDLLPLIDLLLELLGLLVVDEGKAGQAVFQLKGVKEDPVLVVLEGIIDLLIPYDPTI